MDVCISYTTEAQLFTIVCLIPVLSNVCVHNAQKSFLLHMVRAQLCEVRK